MSWRKGSLAAVWRWMWERGCSPGPLSPPHPCAEPAKSLLGFYMGRGCQSFLSDSLIAGHPGLATFFSPNEVVAQSTDPFAGSEQRKESPEPLGVWGPRSCPGAAREKHGSPLLGGLAQLQPSWPPSQGGCCGLRVRARLTHGYGLHVPVEPWE